MTSAPVISAADLGRALCDHFSSAITVAPDDHAGRRGGVIATLPVRDLYGDDVSLYIDAERGAYMVTDGGFAFRELASLTGTVRPDADLWNDVEDVARRHGVAFDGGELNVEVAAVRAVGSAAAAVAQAVVEALYLGRGRVPNVAAPFIDEVDLFLRDHSIRYEANARLDGVSGARHRVDFVLHNGTPHVAQAVASEQAMRRSLNLFYDLAEGTPAVRPIAFIDEERPGYANATFQQLAYKAQVFEWRRRDEFLAYWAKAHQSATS